MFNNRNNSNNLEAPQSSSSTTAQLLTFLNGATHTLPLGRSPGNDEEKRENREDLADLERFFESLNIGAPLIHTEESPQGLVFGDEDEDPILDFNIELDKKEKKRKNNSQQISENFKSNRPMKRQQVLCQAENNSLFKGAHSNDEAHETSQPSPASSSSLGFGS